MTDMTEALLLVQLVAALALGGLIWTVQVVHYPLFAAVGRASFGEYHTRHMQRMTWVVAPLMLTELGAAAWWLVETPDEVSRAASLTLAGLVAVCWASTAFVQVPLHRRLESGGPTPEVVRRLVSTNWVRTVAWTVRAGWLTVLAWG